MLRTIWLQVVPRRNSAVLGFSTAFGALFSKALFERAVRGFLRARMSILEVHSGVFGDILLTFGAASLRYNVKTRNSANEAAHDGRPLRRTKKIANAPYR
jgi:hypothetical protein